MLLKKEGSTSCFDKSRAFKYIGLTVMLSSVLEEIFAVPRCFWVQIGILLCNRDNDTLFREKYECSTNRRHLKLNAVNMLQPFVKQEAVITQLSSEPYATL